MGNAKVSEIDRLIELASDEKPVQGAATEMPRPKNGSLSLQTPEYPKDSKPSMWRILLQLRIVLPYLARVLPVLERSVLGTNVLSGGAPVQHTVDTTRFDEGISGLEDAHRGLAAQLKNQSVELKNQSLEIKSFQEQLGWFGKSIERQAQRQEEIAASVAALRRLVLAWALIGLILLVALFAVDLLKPAFLR